MSEIRDLVAPAETYDDYMNAVAELATRTEPTLFGMRTKLPSQGRTDMPLAATERMSVILKTYAGGGENALHSHPFEDHSFVVLQGKVVFYGPDGEIGRLHRHQGILLPRGAYYYFQAEPGEPLVMLRFGAVIGDDVEQYDRVNIQGGESAGFDDQNKTVEVILTEEMFG